MNSKHAERVLAHLEREAEAFTKSKAGKVFHTKAHARMPNEKYYMPAWVVRCLLRQVHRLSSGSIWDPAAGDGQTTTAINAYRPPGSGIVCASDLDPDDPRQCAIEKASFMSYVASPAKHIVTNPPFGTGGRLAVKFVHHALRLTEGHGGVVAMLLRDDFDSAKGRRALFADHPAFDRKIVLTDRIRWTNLPQSTTHGPSGSHAWFVWDWARNRDEWPIVQYERADEDPLLAALDRSVG